MPLSRSKSIMDILGLLPIGNSGARRIAPPPLFIGTKPFFPINPYICCFLSTVFTLDVIDLDLFSHRIYILTKKKKKNI